VTLDFGSWIRDWAGLFRIPAAHPLPEAPRKGGAKIGHRKPIWPVYHGWRITLLSVDLHMIITKVCSSPNHDLIT